MAARPSGAAQGHGEGAGAGVFVGTFEHGLDDKGRVVLPSTFRSQLGERGYLSQYDACIGLWSVTEFSEFASRLTEKVRSGLATQEAVRAFAANAHEVRPDSQGRITVPQRLREYAGLERDVVVIGAIDRIELWDAAAWRERASRADASLAEAVTALGI